MKFGKLTTLVNFIGNISEGVDNTLEVIRFDYDSSNTYIFVEFNKALGSKEEANITRVLLKNGNFEKVVFGFNNGTQVSSMFVTPKE